LLDQERSNRLMKKEGKGSLVILFLVEPRRGWSLMIFCAWATRGLRMMGRSSQVPFLLAERAR
jgi:hypothetical protein